MGPPVPSKGLVTGRPLRRCLLCRSEALPSNSKAVMNANLKSCSNSMCTIFGLPVTHPFKIIYEKAQYCANCLKDVQQADVTLGKLELMKQSLLRFQNNVYNLMGDNYFQIANREQLLATFEEFEKGEDAVKGKKFRYDEIVKVVYEKLDNNCTKWERFSSTENTDTRSKTQLQDATTQTENSSTPEQSLPQYILPDTSAIQMEVENEVVWDNDDLGDDAGDEVASSVEDIPAAENDGSSSAAVATVQDPLTTEASSGSPTKLPSDYPFTKPPINFENKIYCTVDPENCKRFFYDNYNLEVHIKSFHENNPRPHVCQVPQCFKSFIDESRLKLHFMRVHVSSEMFMCEHCGDGFATRTILKDHVRRKHIQAKIVKNCGFCGANFNTDQDLNDHENLHRSREFPFSCLYCDSSFPNSVDLKSHYTKFHAENRFPCKICGKIMASEMSLKIHLNIHSGAYKCSECGFSGSCRNALAQHMLTHTNEKPFTCETCGKAFKYVKNLVSHQRVHTGEKPYSCNVCGAKFREVGYLRRHEESHSLTPNYACQTCGAKFKVKENLKKHERTHREDYVPKKKIYIPRTPEQKEARRIRRDAQRREQGILVATRKISSSGSLSKLKKKKENRKLVQVAGTTIKVKEKKKKMKGTSKEKPVKTKKRTKKMQELKMEEEETKEFPKMEEVLEEMVEEEHTFTELEVGHQEEVRAAVQCIQAEEIGEVVVTTGDYFEDGEEVVYQAQPVETHHQIDGQEGGIQTTTTTYIPIPVTVVSTTTTQPVVRTASQLVVKKPNNQYHFI